MTTTTTTRPEICEGVGFLDAEYPQWFDAINIADLDLESSSCCVLGQLAQDMIGATVDYSWGAYEAALDVILDDSNDVEIETRGAWAEDHAFVVVDSERFGTHYDEEAYETLTKEWVTVIEAKRSGAEDGCDE